MVCTCLEKGTSELEPYLDLEKYLLAIIMVLDGDLNIHPPSLTRKKRPHMLLGADSRVQRTERASGKSSKWHRHL